MRPIGQKRPIASYSLPQHRPQVVEEAYARFNEIATK